MPRPDVIVVGASAGGVEALSRFAAGLSPEIHAAVFVVLHMPPESRSTLPLILARVSALPVDWAVDREPIGHRRIYVAPPNRHLLLERGCIRVLAGPRVNGSRPALDPLFRAAAWAYGGRVAGVVLSGTLDDGAAGLRTIKQHGGLAIVQDPQEALFTGMPLSAVESVNVDYCLPAGEIGALLVRLHQDTAYQEGSMLVTLEDTENGDNRPARLERSGVSAVLEAPEAGRMETTGMAKEEGNASGFTCPECDGALWEDWDGNVLQFECRVDHRYTFDTLLTAKAQEVEVAIWAAVNALEERAALLRKSATRFRERGTGTMADRTLEHAVEAEEHAESIRRTLLAAISRLDNGGDALTRSEAGPVSA
jgi:two-component system, chemotaxis family, protein-glutamate methylesterase/glutaminase